MPLGVWRTAGPNVLILFDNNIPRGLARTLNTHVAVEARARSWHPLKNGELLKAADESAFDVIVTSDRSINYQQNLTGRKIRARRIESGPLAD